MRNIKWVFACLSIILLTASFSSAQTAHPLDQFGDVNCEDEMAHLDNFAIEIQSNPGSIGYVSVYGGNYGRRGEAKARASRIKEYLVKSRGLDSNRVMTIDSGYMEHLTVELWLLPRAVSAPPITPTIQPKDVKFKKGKIKRSEYRQCGLGF
ncbi:MAG: hypothetical protein DMF68_00100 [Acidobacteria bacterium]|nr:MAG: hypothetical protein DMF68_00100 [Acidobacteriota bacterium]